MNKLRFSFFSSFNFISFDHIWAKCIYFIICIFIPWMPPHNIFRTMNTYKNYYYTCWVPLFHSCWVCSKNFQNFNTFWNKSETFSVEFSKIVEQKLFALAQGTRIFSLAHQIWIILYLQYGLQFKRFIRFYYLNVYLVR